MISMPDDAPHDPVLAAALAKQAEAARAVAYWDEWIGQYQRLVGNVQAVGHERPVVAESKVESPGTRTGRRTSPVLDQTADMATAIIEKHGRPVPIQEMQFKLRGMGLLIGGKNPKSTLSARLSTSGRFIADREKGWWIKGRPLPGLTLPIEPEGEGLDAGTASSPSSPSAGLGNHEPPSHRG